ncbi:hypothetical protein [Leptolyngbya sp. O-77]|uniref:hypothetical protein n=1 Tax=Leptolyngbya sp. O-77 TaxID=1080068 RepID=UPI000A9C5E50|nr:hypothetical protein [Leptolyngbya sp. O-77]
MLSTSSRPPVNSVSIRIYISLRDRPLSPQHQHLWAIALIQHPHLSAIALYLPNTNTSGRSPPDTSLNLELLTQAYHRSTLASYPKAIGSVRVDRVLEELHLRN